MNPFPRSADAIIIITTLLYFELFRLYTSIDFYSSTQIPAAKSREGVVQDTLFDHTVHTYITYVAIKTP